MGVWGYGIDQSDAYGETYAYCDSLKKEGYSLLQIEEAVLNQTNHPEHILRLFALADYLWKNHGLSNRILQILEDQILSGKDKAFWMEAGLSEDQYGKRKQAVNRFLNKIRSTEYHGRSVSEKESVQTHALKKGDLFWYRESKKTYGGIVLEDVEGYRLYLIGISEELCSNQEIRTNTILESKFYTAAWFSDQDLLPPKRIHVVDHMTINDVYAGFCGLKISDRGFTVSNNGTTDTWKHLHRALSFADCTVESAISRVKLSKF